MLLLLFVDQLDLRYISVNPETSIGLSISFERYKSVNLVDVYWFINQF